MRMVLHHRLRKGSLGVQVEFLADDDESRYGVAEIPDPVTVRRFIYSEDKED